MLIEALRNGVRRTAEPRLLLGRRVSTSSTKNQLHPPLTSSGSAEGWNDGVQRVDFTRRSHRAVAEYCARLLCADLPAGARSGDEG